MVHDQNTNRTSPRLDDQCRRHADILHLLRRMVDDQTDTTLTLTFTHGDTTTTLGEMTLGETGLSTSLHAYLTPLEVAMAAGLTDVAAHLLTQASRGMGDELAMQLMEGTAA